MSFGCITAEALREGLSEEVDRRLLGRYEQLESAAAEAESKRQS